MSLFLCENRKNLLAGGAYAPKPPWPSAAGGSPQHPRLWTPFAKSWVRHRQCISFLRIIVVLTVRK